MSHLIMEVEKDLPAAKAGIQPGDMLLRLNGQDVIDEIDYQALIAEKTVVAELKRNGETISISIEKDEGDPLGLHFG